MNMKTGVGLHMVKVCNPQLPSFPCNTEQCVCFSIEIPFFSFGHKFLKTFQIYPLLLFCIGKRKIFLIGLLSFFLLFVCFPQ